MKITPKNAALLLALLVAGCDSLSNEAYQGERLATIHGVAVMSDRESQPPPLEVMLLWAVDVADQFKLVAERVPVRGQFPAEFLLDLYHPPPSRSAFRARGAGFYIGLITAIRQGALNSGEEFTFDTSNIENPVPADADGGIDGGIGDGGRADGGAGDAGTVPGMGKSSDFFGFAEDNVIYLDRDIPADHPISVVTGGIHKKGFHLVHSVLITKEEQQRRYAACLELLTPVDCGSPESTEGSTDMAPVEGGFEKNLVRLDIWPVVPTTGD